MRTVIALAVVGLFAVPVMAISTPHVAGSMQGWNPGSDPMTETPPASGIYTKTYNGLPAGNREEFKITDGTWGTSIPGANSWLFADGIGDITITYDSNTYGDGWLPNVDRLGLSTDPGAWTAVGDWQSQVGGGDWDNANASTAMAPQGGGIYMLQATLVPGNYNGKAVVTGSWDAIGSDGRSINAGNIGFTTDAVNDTVRIWVDSLGGTAKIDVFPEPSSLCLLLMGGLGLIARRRR